MSETKVILNNKLYDKLKFITQIVLPALGTLYFGLSEIWGFPNGAEVVGTITLIVTFLGVILGISSSAYKSSEARYDGDIVLFEDEGKKQFRLEYKGDPYFLNERDEVLFKVKTQDETL